MDGSFSKDPMRCVLCNTGRWFWFFAFRVPFLALAVCSLLSLSVFRFLSPNLPLCFLSNTHDSFNIVNYPTSLSLSLSLSPNNPKRLFSIKLPPRNVSFLISFSPPPPLLFITTLIFFRLSLWSKTNSTSPETFRPSFSPPPLFHNPGSSILPQIPFSHLFKINSHLSHKFPT